MKKGIVYGIGTNDLKGITLPNGKCDPIYKRWTNLLQRCTSYSNKKDSTYEDCTICEEWLTYSNFKKWMEAQDWRGKHIDKDFLFPGNKEYAPDKCIFISQALNNFTTDRKNHRGTVPVGVRPRPSSNRYAATCSNPITKKRDYLGDFDTPQEAHEAWKKRKHEIACALAENESDPRLKNALKQRYAQ